MAALIGSESLSDQALAPVDSSGWIGMVMEANSPMEHMELEFTCQAAAQL